jgi:hypothetical protein
MDDRVRSMRLVVLLVVVAACGDDPSLHISVKHPTEQRIHDAIRSTVVTVYESDSLTCSEVEFGDRSEDELFALKVAEVETHDGDSTGSLDGISRLDHKVIVARGRGIEGELITAGCVEIDDVESGPAVIETIPAATVTISEAGEMGGILVTTTDPFSRALTKRRVSWRTYGPAGTSANEQQYTNVDDGVWEPKSPSCTRDGEVTVHPQPPSVPAGFAVRLRVSWSATKIPLFTRFNKYETLSQLFSPDPARAIVRRCALRKTASAPASIVCLANRNNAIEIRLSGGGLVTQPASVSSAVAVVSVQNGDQRDVYAIDDLGNWTALFGSTPVNTGTIPNPWCPGTCTADETPTPLDVLIVPACGSSPGGLLARVERGTTTPTSEVLISPLRGGPATLSATDGPLASAGCLTELQADGSSLIRQAVVFGELETPPMPSFVTFPCSGAPTMRCTIPINDGAAFVPGDEPRMMISAFDATGTVLSSVVARPNESMTRDNLIERTRQPAAAPPQEIVFGQFDTDTELDAFWYFAPPFGRNSTNIQVAYAREVDNVPLTALDRFDGIITEAYAANLDNDERDEILAVVSGNLPSLHVLPMGSTIADQTPADPPCP